MTLDEFISRLDGTRRSGRGWLAKCPAHPDKNPSLSIHNGERGLLVKCWAGCTLQEICSALDIREADLFFDATLPHGHKPTNRPARVDRRSLAFRYDLAALDLRLRADRIVAASQALSLETLTDDDLDRALSHVAQAHADTQRVELFEGVADDLRMKDFLGRETGHARRERVA
jgi:hypothetical protein